MGIFIILKPFTAADNEKYAVRIQWYCSASKNSLA